MGNYLPEYDERRARLEREIADLKARLAQAEELPTPRALAMAEKQLRIKPNALMDHFAAVLATSAATWAEEQTAGRYLDAIRSLRARSSVSEPVATEGKER